MEKKFNRKGTWVEFANYIIREGYNTVITFEDEEDGTDDAVFCPECSEPILRMDYDTIEKTEEGCFICPICECEL